MTENNETRGPMAWMAGNSVAANLLMLVLLIGGVIWGTRIKQEVFPEFELDIVSISVSYPGASPQEVEQGIILAVEQAVQGLEGVGEMTASANEGGGTVTIEAIVGTDMQKLSNEIQNEVDRISSFPEEAEDPVIRIAARRREVISIALYGDQNEHILRETAERIRDDLLMNPNITQVDLDAVRDPEISVEISQEKLRAYQLTLGEVAQVIRSASVELPGGGIKTSGGEVLVRMNERKDYAREFARIPIITRSDGTQVLLEEIAVINDGFEDSGKSASYNGKPAVLIEVYRVADQTPIEVADTVKAYMTELKETLPPGLEANILRDRSDIYRQRLDLLVRNGYLGLALVFTLLGLFLEPRLAFWVAMGIPISFLGSLLFLPFMDVSINMISMFAFIVSLGIVVDDAIVVGENIYTYRQKGYPFLKASIIGAQEVSMPVTFSILTNVVAFMPLCFVPGIMGKIFRVIPIVVVTTFIISLIEGLFVLPAHLAHQSGKTPGGLFGRIYHFQQRFSKGFTRMVHRFYAPFLDLALRNRYLTLSVGIAILLIVLAVVKSGRLGMTLFPRIESDFARATAVLPYGTSVRKTEAIQKLLVERAKEVAEKNGGKALVTGIFAEIRGDNITRVNVYLTHPKKRPISTSEFINQWRKATGPVPGTEYLVFKSDAGGPGSRSALTVELTHRDLDVLEKASADLAEALDYFPAVKDIDDGFSPGKQQIDFTIRPEGRSLGLTAREIANQVRHSFYGVRALRQQRGRNEITVMVRLPENQRVSEYNLEEMILRTPKGTEAPLRDVVNIKRGRAYTEISRRDGQRVVTVTADVVPPENANQVLESLKADVLPDLVGRYSGLNYSFEGRQAEMRDSMKSLGKGLLLALIVMYGLLAIPFKSYIQPVIVMISIPFGIVGAVLGHILMGYSLSVMSSFGIVALSGVVVNDSLILIDFANRRRRAGESPHDAVHASGIQRFRPILLTTLTTFGGLAPMIFETSRQARFLIPMAISLGFGVLFATAITLILVPCFYMALEDMHGLKRIVYGTDIREKEVSLT